LVATTKRDSMSNLKLKTASAISIALFFFISTHLYSQNSWINYVNDHLIYDLVVDGDQLWVGAQNGLIKHNLSTGEKEVFQAWNSPLQGQGIRSIAIGKDGEKWFGTENGGLFKYDNESWERFYETNTSNNLDQVREIKVDQNGHPWFIAFDFRGQGIPQFLSYHDFYFMSHNSIIEGDVHGHIRDFDFIESSLWVLQTKRLIKYNGEEVLASFSFFDITQDEDEGIYSVDVDKNGDLWVVASKWISLGPGNNGYSATRLLKFDGENWTEEISSKDGIDVFVGGDENLWIALYNDYDNIVQYGTITNGVWDYLTESDLPHIPSLFNDFSQLHFVDSNGDWWMQNFNGILEPKIYKVNNSKLSTFSTQIFPLAANYYDAIVKDCNENIWILEKDAFSSFDGENWQNFKVPGDGLSGSPRDAFLHPETCEIWMSINHNGGEESLAIFDGNNIEYLSYNDENTTNIAIGPDGTVYATAQSTGLLTYKDGIWKLYNEENSPLDGNRVLNVQVQLDSTIWLSTSGNRVIRKQENEWTIFDETNSPFSTNSFVLYLDNNDYIWAEIENGIAKWTGTTWEVFVLDEKLSDISNITQDQFGNYWLSTIGNGAFYWNGSDFIQYNTTNSGIASNNIYNILVDSLNGDVWFMQNSGVSVLQDFDFQRNLSGFTFFDNAQNGTYEPGEDIRLPNQQVLLLPDSTIALTNSIGAYTFYPDNFGTYTIEHNLEEPNKATTPSFHDVFYTTESIEELNFGLWRENIPEGIDIDITHGPIVCSKFSNFWITITNEGFEDIEGELNFDFGPDFEYYNSFPEAIINQDGQANWSFSNLGFLEKRVHNLRLFTPGVDFLDQIFTFVADVNTTDGQAVSKEVETEILCSYDPNDKLASPLGESIDNYSLLNDPIEYTIRFQNLGNYKATDVLISDFIDQSLDISTLQVISSSHTLTTTIDRSREVVFRFENIDLPPEEEDPAGSQGFIKYQITPLPNLPDPTIIENTASIFFDQNPAIVTNTTENILVESLTSVSTSNQFRNKDVAVYPNPTNQKIWIEWPNSNLVGEWSVKVYDLSGRVYLEQNSAASKLELDIKETGFYILVLQKGDFIQNEKIVVVD